MMKKNIINFISHPLIKGSTIIFFGSLIANLCSYLFNLILGRFLVVTDYGIYASLISFLGIFGIFPSTFTAIFAKFSARYKANNQPQNTKIIFTQGFKITIFFATGLLLLLLISISFIASFLHITDIRLLILIFLTIYLSIILSVPLGILQGEMRLYMSSLVSIISPILKIIIGFALLFLGFKILGVSISMFASSFITLILVFIFFRFQYSKNNISNTNKLDFFPEFKIYGWQFFLSAIGITILTSTDILFVKHFFSPEKAGQYAALSVMGKSIFYLTSPINYVFFPLIAQKKERKENIHNTLLLAICIILLCSIGISLFYFLFPNIILSVFFPAKEYRVLSSLLGPFSLYIIIFSIAMLLSTFLLSIGKTEIYKINLLVSVIFVALFILFHQTIMQIIWVLSITSLLLITLYLIYYVPSLHAKE